MIKNIKIYGERCSGTNWLEAIISGKSYFYNNARKNEKNFFSEGKPAFNIPVLEANPFGHKHFFGDWYNEDIKTKGDNTLFIGIVRNFYDHSSSLLKHKHHIPEINYSARNFFNNEWYSIHHNKKSPKYGKEIIEDRNWFTGERYKNIFELRKNKIEYLLNTMPKIASNYILIKYEDMVENVDEVIESISKQFNLPIINKNFVKSQKKQIKPNHLNDNLGLINERIDWEIESKLGYQPLTPINSIEDFIQYCDVDEDFDEKCYQSLYPETYKFYQPYCIENNITDRNRLFFHYVKYGKPALYHKNLSSFAKEFCLDLSNPNDDIERLWPPDKTLLENYKEKSNIGKNISANSKIAVVALARQCEKKLQNSIDLINSLVNNDLRWFVYENDSTDDTKEILSKNKSEKFNISLNVLGKKYLTDRSLSRTVALANYRNICLEWVNKNFPDFDYTIVLDLDADKGFSVDGIYNSIYWLNHIENAGGMGSYSMTIQNNHPSSVGVYHYDSFAVRLNDWKDSEEQDHNNRWFRYFNPKIGSNPIPFYSCFGGLAVYKTQAFLSSKYDGSIGAEHIGLHKGMQENGWDMYLNPSSRFISIYKL